MDRKALLAGKLYSLFIFICLVAASCWYQRG